ncbi:protein giant-lens-like [Limulus polyphemus]|uniref:Protein giant-lens-like n=1 Tax=Limulus polyphemus TaxID=6850 RepID=A0ABM1T8H5_LIMPO|nr:protein giant-lens-like [Limulus polyphemus]
MIRWVPHKRELVQRNHRCQMIVILFIVDLMVTVTASKLPLTFRHGHKPPFPILYQTGNSEEDLPECGQWSVCNRVDTYSTPWVERRCRCPGKKSCSLSLDDQDGHTVVSKTRQYKVCESVRKLPICKYIRDVTWTYVENPDNSTEQTIHCVCPKKSSPYIIKRHSYSTSKGTAHRYSFACSPQTSLLCQRKEPCRLFSVRKRSEVEDVNTDILCHCPHSYTCPDNHKDSPVILEPSYHGSQTRTYSGYCTLDVDR